MAELEGIEEGIAETRSIIRQETIKDVQGKESWVNLEPDEGFFATTDLNPEELEQERAIWTGKKKDGHSCLEERNIRAMHIMSLANCNLEKVPSKLCEITGLKRLCLSTNQLRTLPTEFGKLRHLTNLSLASNKLDRLPEALCMLNRLEVLSLQHNHLTTDGLRNIGKLICLEELSLASNSIKEFPAGVCELKNLRLLDIRFNFLSSLPVDIYKLQEIRVLLVRRNVVKTLPPSISGLKHLKLACFGDNCIEQVDFESVLTGLPKLMDFCLHANRLKNKDELEQNIARFAKQGKLLRVNENRADISQKITCDSPYEYIWQDILLIHDGTKEVKAWVEKLTEYLTKHGFSNKSVGPNDEINGKALDIRREVNVSRVIVPICTPLLLDMTDNRKNQKGEAIRNSLSDLVQKRKLDNFLLVIKEPCSLESNWLAAGGNINVSEFSSESETFVELKKKIAEIKGQRLHMASTSLM